jgi:hypothetical protein
MDKIRDLLKQIGASEELASQLCEELERYDRQIQEKYEGVYQSKLTQAKTICVEEVDKYKVDLASKVRIFLESKSGQIENRLDQLRAIEEGDAKAMLRRVREITEDIEVADDAELLALKDKLEKLKTNNRQLAEEKKKAITAANRANKIALEVIERKGITVSEETEKSVPEPKEKETKKTVAESKKIADEKIVSEVKKVDKQKKALKEDVARKTQKTARPKTTRRTLSESQKTPTAKPMDESLGIEADSDILDIANNL